MRVELQELKKGWFDVSLGLKKKDVEAIIGCLEKLRKEKNQHFHLQGNYENSGGISDIEIYLDNDSATDNLTISGFAK